VGIALVLVLIVLVVVFNLARTLLTYFNYQLNLKDRHLTASYGLTDSHIISVPAIKVQMFQYQQNYFQKRMNLFEVKIKQVDSTEDNKNKKGLIIPGASKFELSNIFRVIFSKDLSLIKKYYKPNIGVLILKFLWLCVPFIIGLSVMYFSDNIGYSWVLIPVFIVVYLLICIGYRNERLMFENDFIITKKGVWDITTTYFSIDKIQKITIEQSYFQEKSKIGSLNLHSAAGMIRIYYYDFNMLQQLTNEILYKIEKNKHSWM